MEVDELGFGTVRSGEVGFGKGKKSVGSLGFGVLECGKAPPGKVRSV